MSTIDLPEDLPEDFIPSDKLLDEGIMSLRNILNGITLADFQTGVLAWALVNRKMMISLDTGLGKTLISAGLIRLVTEPGAWLFICQLNSIPQTYKKFRELIPEKRIMAATGSADTLASVIKSNPSQVDVYILSYEAFRDLDCNTWILSNQKKFIGFIADESHNIANTRSTIRDFMYLLWQKDFAYKYCLTATPLRVNPGQFLNQMAMIDPTLVPDPKLLLRKYTVYDAFTKKVIGYKNLDELHNIIHSRYINKCREELGMKGAYNPRFIPIPNVDDQENAHSPDSPKIQKSNPQGLPIQELKNLILRYTMQGKRGIVYANLNKYKSLIIDSLKDYIRIDEISGRVDSQARARVQREFNEGKLDCICLNATESLDLPCDYIVFYELTSLYKQVIGRGERGLTGKDLDIVFMVITDNYDLDFFFDHVYSKGILLEQLCHKDVSELHAINSQIQEYLSEQQSYVLREILSLYEEEMARKKKEAV